MKTLKGKEKLSKQLFNVGFKGKERIWEGREKKKKKKKTPKSETLQNKSYLGRLLFSV